MYYQLVKLFLLLNKDQNCNNGNNYNQCDHDPDNRVDSLRLFCILTCRFSCIGRGFRSGGLCGLDRLRSLCGLCGLHRLRGSGCGIQAEAVGCNVQALVCRVVNDEVCSVCFGGAGSSDVLNTVGQSKLHTLVQLHSMLIQHLILLVLQLYM